MCLPIKLKLRVKIPMKQNDALSLLLCLQTDKKLLLHKCGSRQRNIHTWDKYHHKIFSIRWHGPSLYRRGSAGILKGKIRSKSRFIRFFRIFYFFVSDYSFFMASSVVSLPCAF